MKRSILFGLTIGGALLLGGCGSNPPPANSTVADPSATLDDGTPMDSTANNEDRPIAPQDVLQISIVGEKTDQTVFPVTASGYIQFPYLDLVRVEGLTPTEVKELLEKKLVENGYFVRPQVLVTVNYHERYVRVLGAVRKPGLVPLKGDRKMDILDVISFAGGLTPYAKNTIEYTHNGVRRTISLDDLKKAGPNERIWVHPDDIIEVKESIL